MSEEVEMLRSRIDDQDSEISRLGAALSTLTGEIANQLLKIEAADDDFIEPQGDGGFPEADTRISFFAKITALNSGDDEFPYDWEEARWNAASSEMEVIPSTESRYSSAVHGKARDPNENEGYEVGDFVLITRVITNQNAPQPWQHIITTGVTTHAETSTTSTTSDSSGDSTLVGGRSIFPARITSAGSLSFERVQRNALHTAWVARLCRSICIMSRLP